MLMWKVPSIANYTLPGGASSKNCAATSKAVIKIFDFDKTLIQKIVDTKRFMHSS